MHSRRLLIVLLALLCVALASVVASEVSGTDANAPEPSARGASVSSKLQPAAASAASFSLPELGSFTIVAERPLFSPSRRPAARAADGSGAWSSFVLAGIIITSQTREALVVHGNPPTIAHLAQGQTVDGWTISAIYPDRVVFSDRFNEHELKLVDKTKSPPPSVSPRPRRPPP